MSGPVPTLGYRSRSAAAVALRGQGFSHAEIGRRIGVRTHVVGALIASGLRARHPLPPVEQLVVTLDTATGAGLCPAAQARGISLGQLASRILAAAVEGSLIDAILDDGGEP